MKCSKCGNEIEEVVVTSVVAGQRYNDARKLSRITGRWIEFEVPDYWLGKTKPQKDIRCPKCGEFPFKNQDVRVDIYYKVACFEE